MNKSIVDQFSAACSNAGQVCIDHLPNTPANGDTVQTILTIVIRVIAAVALLFVVIGGIRYVLSQGDPGAVSKAKATIVYALIGLVVAIVAQAIVVFVIRGVGI